MRNKVWGTIILKSERRIVDDRTNTQDPPLHAGRSGWGVKACSNIQNNKNEITVITVQTNDAPGAGYSTQGCYSIDL